MRSGPLPYGRGSEGEWTGCADRAGPAQVDALATDGRTATVPTHRGRVVLLLGCMFSGKTSELLARLSAVPATQRQVFKHDRDHRYRRAAVVTHAGQAIPAQPVTRARDLLPQLRPNTRLVALDEAHFFGGDLLDVADVLRIRGIEFLITALDVDSWGRVFPVLEELRALADEVVLLRATCARCGAVAVRTHRTTPIRGADYTAGQNAECLLIGGAEAFEPRCVACWSPPPEAPPTLPVP